MAKKYNIKPMKAKKISKEKEKETEEVIEETPKSQFDDLSPREKDERIRVMRIKMMKSALITYPIAIVFFVLAALIMTQVIKFPETEDETIKVLITILKGILPVGFFYFMIVSMGNVYEARGGIMDWKHILTFGLIAVFMVIIDGNVVLVTLLGIVLVVAYFYFIQARTEMF